MKDLNIAVTGNPVLHSLSPRLFNHYFRASSEHAGSSTYSRIGAQTALEAIELFQKLKLDGMNVTAPFKREIVQYLDELDEGAKLLGTANTIVNRDNRLVGYNTDFLGVEKCLNESGHDFAYQEALVIGAGGAAQAAAFALLRQKAKVTVVNRTRGRANQLSKELGVKSDSMENLEYLMGNARLLVYTIPSSALDPQSIIKKELLLKSNFHNLKVVLDANYSYKGSNLAGLFEGTDIKYVSGREWLVNQAIYGYRHFFDKSIDEHLFRKGVNGSQGCPYKENKNISLIGFMGSGKSTIGKILAQERGFNFIDVDMNIEKRANKSIYDIIKSEGEDYFRRLESEEIGKIYLEGQSVKSVIACGGGAVIDSKNMETIKNNSLVVWPFVSVDESYKRVERQAANRGKRPLLDCQNPLGIARTLFQERREKYLQVADMILDTETKTPHEMVRQISWELNAMLQCDAI